MKNYIPYFLFISFTVVDGRIGELWSTCEKNPHEFQCYEWCLRLNNYVEKYTRMMEFGARMWQDLAEIAIACIIPGIFLVYAMRKLYESYKTHRENYRRKLHRKRITQLNRGPMKNTLLTRYGKDEKAPDSVKERPIREGIIHKMKLNTDLETKYLEFRRKRLLEEMELGDVSNSYKYYDKLVLPERLTDMEYVDEQVATDVLILKHDPMFVQENVAMEWDVFTPQLKAAAEEAAKMAMDLTTKTDAKGKTGIATEIDKTERAPKQMTSAAI